MGGHGHGEVSIAKPMRADGIPRADDKIVQITFVDPNNVSMTVDAFCGETLLDCARRYQVGLRDLCSGRMPVASADYDAGLGVLSATCKWPTSTSTASMRKTKCRRQRRAT